MLLVLKVSGVKALKIELQTNGCRYIFFILAVIKEN